MKVLILGAGGQVGAELSRVCGDRGDHVIAMGHADLDITDGARVREIVRHQAPEVVFNAAGYTAVDRAEQEPELADTINHRAVLRLGQVCRDLATPVLHFSTDYVFDGSATSPIPEDAPTAPLGAYGRTKRDGEVALLNSGAEAVVVRSSWVYGLEGQNFIRTVLRVCREKGEMRVVDDQRGSPTWARDLAVAGRRLAELRGRGIYHVTNSAECTWYELALAVVQLAGIDARIDPIATVEYPTPARRPAYSVLANARWLRLGEPPLRHWREALAECIAEMGPEMGPEIDR